MTPAELTTQAGICIENAARAGSYPCRLIWDGTQLSCSKKPKKRPEEIVIALLTKTDVLHGPDDQKWHTIMTRLSRLETI